MRRSRKNPYYGSYHRSQNPWIGREIITALENPLGREGTAVVLIGTALLAGAAAFVFWPKKASTAVTPAPAPPGPKVVNLIEGDTGKTIVMSVGDVLYIRLGLQSGTGYTWSFQQITSTPGPTTDPLEQEETPEQGAIVRYEGGSGPGEPQFAIVRFTAKRAGAAKVRAQLQRGGQGAIARVFEVVVTVLPVGVFV